MLIIFFDFLSKILLPTACAIAGSGFTSVRSFGYLVLTRPQSALVTQRLIHAAVRRHAKKANYILRFIDKQIKN